MQRIMRMFGGDKRLEMKFNKDCESEDAMADGYDEVDGRHRDKTLSALTSRSRNSHVKLFDACSKYSKVNFKSTKSLHFLRFIKKSQLYDSPLHFPIFDLPSNDVIKATDQLMLEAIRLILEELDKNVLPNMDQQDDYVYKMSKHIGNLIGPKHPMGKLDSIINDPSRLTWRPVEQNLQILETIADDLKKSRWPILKNKDGAVPNNKLEEVTRARLITLTLMKQLSQLMSELHRVTLQIPQTNT